MADDDMRSRYLDYLPAIYHEDLAGRFLLAFERLLTGVGNTAEPGLEEILEGIPDRAEPLRGVERYFDPGPGLAEGERAPREFLEWLAGWVALVLREEWSEEEKRAILAKIVSTYQQRGTKEGLRQVLSVYAGLPLETIEILELRTSLFLGSTAIVASGTALDEGPPHYFLVRVRIPVTGPGDQSRREQILRRVIDQEKPAHTWYDLELDVSTLQIAVRSTVGVDTVLGTTT